ncbi:MAG: hypothetical protein KGQ69_09330, partial [Rhodospirillales bacterium]|nr:hypothetical protein [Rhodospirillales bacterium]
SFDEKMIGYYLYYNRVSGNRGAKKFWQKSLQRKNGAHISDRMYAEYAARGISKSNIQKIRKYRQVEEDVLNACTHPSFVALSINTVGTNIKEDVAYSLPFHGSIDDSLLRTIHYAVYVLGQYVMIGYVPTVDELSKSTRKETFLRGGYSHLKGARIVLLGLLDYLQRGH